MFMQPFEASPIDVLRSLIFEQLSYVRIPILCVPHMYVCVCVCVCVCVLV
jgi:hypothetical protein